VSDVTVSLDLIVLFHYIGNSIGQFNNLFVDIDSQFVPVDGIYPVDHGDDFFVPDIFVGFCESTVTSVDVVVDWNRLFVDVGVG